MFIATNAHGMISLRQERNAAAERLPRQAKAIALLRSFGVRKDRQAIDISPLWGEVTNTPLAYEVELATSYV
jgi:hypothetical protein